MTALHLTPCPFCRSPDVLVQEVDCGQWASTCSSCGTIGPQAPSAVEAGRGWNSRVRSRVDIASEAMAAIIGRQSGHDDAVANVAIRALRYADALIAHQDKAL